MVVFLLQKTLDVTSLVFGQAKQVTTCIAKFEGRFRHCDCGNRIAKILLSERIA